MINIWLLLAFSYAFLINHIQAKRKFKRIKKIHLNLFSFGIMKIDFQKINLMMNQSETLIHSSIFL
jgi:hypothetical protein